MQAPVTTELLLQSTLNEFTPDKDEQQSPQDEKIEINDVDGSSAFSFDEESQQAVKPQPMRPQQPKKQQISFNLFKLF